MRLSPKEIANAIDAEAKRNGVLKGIFGVYKGMKTLRWRYVAMALAREQGYTLAQIGRALDRDHTTVVHGIRKHKQAIERGDILAIRACHLGRERLGHALTQKMLALQQPNREAVSLELIEAWYRDGRARIEIDRRKAEIEETKRLRGKGWSIPGLAKRYEVSEREIAGRLGEWIEMEASM